MLDERLKEKLNSVQKPALRKAGCEKKTGDHEERKGRREQRGQIGPSS